jgi:hypothetical protein
MGAMKNSGKDFRIVGGGAKVAAGPILEVHVASN